MSHSCQKLLHHETLVQRDLSIFSHLLLSASSYSGGFICHFHLCSTMNVCESSFCATVRSPQQHFVAPPGESCFQARLHALCFYFLFWGKSITSWKPAKETEQEACWSKAQTVREQPLCSKLAPDVWTLRLISTGYSFWHRLTTKLKALRCSSAPSSLHLSTTLLPWYSQH